MVVLIDQILQEFNNNKHGASVIVMLLKSLTTEEEEEFSKCVYEYMEDLKRRLEVQELSTNLVRLTLEELDDEYDDPTVIGLDYGDMRKTYKMVLDSSEKTIKVMQINLEFLSKLNLYFYGTYDLNQLTVELQKLKGAKNITPKLAVIKGGKYYE